MNTVEQGGYGGSKWVPFGQGCFVVSTTRALVKPHEFDERMLIRRENPNELVQINVWEGWAVLGVDQLDGTRYWWVLYFYAG